jgi:predicted nucleic acid-binding protein
LIVVLDASTFVSAALKPDSTPDRAMLRIVDLPNTLTMSRSVEIGYQNVIFRPKFNCFVSIERRQRILEYRVVRGGMD